MPRESPEPDAERAAERDALLVEIAAEARATARWIGRGAFAPRVMRALRRVPRHAFVRAEDAERAYRNAPLPIGHGQTISQPYIVALMTDLASPGPDDRVLEVGTGCGYQTAVLAELAARVVSVERVPELAAAARERLRRLGYPNTEVRVGDGAAGWPEQAPFDAILVTAAAPEIPPALIEQLAAGGRLAIPVGPGGEAQELVLLEKDAEGTVDRRGILPVAFVPLRRSGGE